MFGREIGSLEKKSRHWTDSVFVRTLSCYNKYIDAVILDVYFEFCVNTDRTLICACVYVN